MLVRRELPIVPALPRLPLLGEFLGFEPFREMAPFFEAEPGVEMGFAPSFDVKETKEAWVFKADLPGIAEKDIEVSLSGSRLTVSGKREEEKKDEGDVYYTWERSYGTFTRSFTLPEGVDLEHVEAAMKEGVLTIVAAKKPEVKPHKISIKGLIEKVKGGKEEAKA
ncbi:MAG TPA: Hsp20/alpha crystallin family protein [Myxococcales bacterium]|nr:Hsp20/alpha crystallin family protein [Myxococcales bacterium]